MDELSHLKQTMVHFWEELNKALEDELLDTEDDDNIAMEIKGLIEDLALSLDVELPED